MQPPEPSTDYVSLSELLNRSGSPLVLPELHGGLSGVLCAGGRAAGANWIAELLDDCTADADTLLELAQQLSSLGDSTWTDLSGMSLQFAPLLPDESSSIDSRAEALALWCHGFVAGLAVGGLDLAGVGEPLSDEVSELVGDFIEISKARPDASEAANVETYDNALTELEEFVRVGTQYIFEELIANSDAAPKRTIH